jgi:hypothetical protein
MKSHARIPSMFLALFMTMIFVLVIPGAAGAQEIPWAGPTSLPDYIGAPAKAHPLSPVGVPQDPFLAANSFSNVHNDAWQSDVYDIAGPLGRWPAMLSSPLDAARQHTDAIYMMECGTVTFDSRGRIVATCGSPFGGGESSLVLIDPITLEVLAYSPLEVPGSQEAAYGASYMYLDNHDQAVVTQTAHVLVFGQTGPMDKPQFELLNDYDLSQWVVSPEFPNDNIQSVMPDWQGRLWFATRHSGLVGVLEPATGTVLGTLRLGEEISNSFAITEDSAYVVTIRAMYRLKAGLDGAPRVVWQSQYQNIKVKKPGQLSAGSGTSPTILGGGKYVAINDNADQMHIVVYPTAVDHKAAEPVEQAPVCEVPVFQPGAGATEDSLNGLDRSLIVANQYGVNIDPQTWKSQPTVPGIARVDIDPNGKGCSLVWTNYQVAAPQVSPKMSTRTGLVYFYNRKDDPSGLDVYYWTAVDFRTGAIVWEQLVGTGPQFDTFVPGPTIGPNGLLYVGLYGGLLSIRDAR